MSEAPAGSGDYPIERRAGEVERLRIQSDALAADTEAMLERIGVRPGWRCLDGCGPGGITGALAARVGPDGEVLGLDFDAEFVAIAREGAPANTRFMTGNAYATGLRAASFDLVHTRFLAGTAGDPEGLIAEALRLVRPGGVVAMQEPEATSTAFRRIRRGRRCARPGSAASPGIRRSAGAAALPDAAPRRSWRCPVPALFGRGALRRSLAGLPARDGGIAAGAGGGARSDRGGGVRRDGGGLPGAPGQPRHCLHLLHGGAGLGACSGGGGLSPLRGRPRRASSSVLWLGEPLRSNHAVGFGFIVLGGWFVFQKFKAQAGDAGCKIS